MFYCGPLARALAPVAAFYFRIAALTFAIKSDIQFERQRMHTRKHNTLTCTDRGAIGRTSAHTDIHDHMHTLLALVPHTNTCYPFICFDLRSIRDWRNDCDGLTRQIKGGGKLFRTHAHAQSFLAIDFTDHILERFCRAQIVGIMQAFRSDPIETHEELITVENI